MDASSLFEPAQESLLLSLPYELLLKILVTLPPRDLTATHATCNALRQATDDDILWGEITRTTYTPGAF